MFNKTNKNIHPYSNYLLFIPFLFQFLLYPLTLTETIDFKKYEIFAYIIFLLPILLSIVYSCYKIFKNKIVFKKQDFIKPTILFICLLIALIFNIFTNNNFRGNNHDVNYYINISKNFAYSIYSSGPLINDHGSLVSSLSNHYLYPQMYYTYGTLFKSDIIAAYNTINNLIVSYVILATIQEICEIYFKDKRYYYLLMIILLLPFIFITLTPLSQNSNSGNFNIQSLIILLFFINFKKYTKINIMSFISLLGLSFFSSTGLLIALIPSIILCIYYLFKNNIGKNIAYWPIVGLIIVATCFTFTNILSNSLIRLIINYLAIILTIIWMLFWKIFLIKSKSQVFNYQIKWNQANNFLNSKKGFYIILGIYFAIFIYVGLSTLLFMDLLIDGHLHYHKSLFSACGATLLLLITYHIFNYLNKKRFNFLVLIAFLTSFLAVSEILISYLVKYSASTWRLLYLCPGYGNSADFILIIIFCIYFAINQICLFMKDKQWYRRFQLLHHGFINVIKNKKFYIGFISLGLNFLAIFLMLSMYTNSIFLQRKAMNSNVILNMSFITSKDKKMINNLSFDNFKKTYITDMPIYAYINEGLDLTGYLNYPNGKMSSYKWNFNNFYEGIKQWNDDNYGEKIPLKSPEKVFELLLKPIIDKIPDGLTSYVNNVSITSLDYIILNKHTDYYNYISEQLVVEKEGENITIFKLK